MRATEVEGFMTRAGLSPEEAVEWADAHIGPNEAGTARSRGLSIEDVLRERAERLRDARWAGFGTFATEEWKAAGFTEEEARPWFEREWRVTDAEEWRRHGFDAEVATAWNDPHRAERVTVADAVERATAGLPPGAHLDDELHDRELADGQQRLSWGRWRSYFVAVPEQVLVDVRQRGRDRVAIRDAATWTDAANQVGMVALEHECAPQLDRRWRAEWVPAPGEDLTPLRPVGWLPEGPIWLDRAWYAGGHPLDMIHLAWSVSSFEAARRGASSRFPFLWQLAAEMVDLAVLAAATDYILRRDDDLVASTLDGSP